MSEFIQNTNLILGIIGTTTGTIALFISYWTYRKESPHLKINVIKCEHNFEVSRSVPDRKTISFWTDFLIKNVGDRGTTIEDIELTFENSGKTYKLRKASYRDQHVIEKRISVSPHDSFDLSADFWEVFTGDEEDQIDCIFTIYHTHGAERTKAVSQRRKEGKIGVIMA
jgi:hypothetical protein